MLEKYYDDDWFGAISKEVAICSPNDSASDKIIKILEQCKSGNFDNTKELVELSLKATDNLTLMVSFKILMLVLSNDEIERYIDRMNVVFEYLMENDSDCILMSQLSSYIIYSSSINSIKPFLSLYGDLDGMYPAESIGHNIAYMLLNDYNASIDYSFENVDDTYQMMLQKCNENYYFEGNVIDINKMADSFLKNVETCFNKKEKFFHLVLLNALGFFTGIKPPEVQQEKISAELLEDSIQFVKNIKEKNFIANKKYFYGYEVK